MVDFPIVDTHVHLWEPQRLRYPWLDEIEQLNRPFLPADFDRHIDTARVEKVVFVQCDCVPEQSAEEVSWVTHLAQTDQRIAGIVAGAALEKGNAVRADVAALADNPLVKGVRRILQGESAEFCLQPNFVTGVQLLADYELTFDICIYHHQMANVNRLIAQCPNVTFVLDHIGKPAIKTQQFSSWAADLQRMANLPNVWCKLSGLATEADHAKWTADELQPYIDHVINCFGFDRLMFGGDWPVSTLATTYPRWVETLQRAVARFSAEDQHNLFYQNGTDFYRLG